MKLTSGYLLATLLLFSGFLGAEGGLSDGPVGAPPETCCCVPASLTVGYPNCNTQCGEAPYYCDVDDGCDTVRDGGCKVATVGAECHTAASSCNGATKTFTPKKYSCDGPESCSPPQGGNECSLDEIGDCDVVVADSCTGTVCLESCFSGNCNL